MKLSTFLFAGVLASQLGNTECGGDALKDPGFDLWCGDSLCAWKLERGTIARVPSWNKGDPAVELVGDDTAIEQLSPVDSSDGTCIEFTMIADVDDNVDVELNVDVLGDGSVEHHERLPSAHWKPLSYQLFVQQPYAGIRFELAKTGSGRAVVADLGAKVVTGCQGLAPIVAGPAALGAPCMGNTDCTSGLCGASALPPPFKVGFGVCVACDDTHPCGAGEVCGAGYPTSAVRAVPTECIPLSSKDLGDQCASGAECASAICQYQTCSTCATDAQCPSGEQCGAGWPTPFGVNAPWVCAPGSHAHATGEPCASDDDCASSACGGAERSQCPDGRACATDIDCPFGGGTDPFDPGDPLTHGTCAAFGIQGGTCQ